VSDTTDDVRDDVRDDLVQRLREHLSDGVPIAAAALPRELYMTSLARFGSITSARRAAGLPESMPSPRRWSEAVVIEELRRLHALGLEIRERELTEGGHSGVVVAARIHCGGLARARRLARIFVARRIARARSPWDGERVIAEIRALHGDGQPLASSRVDPRLQCAARRYFGTWGDAVEAAGVDYDDVRMHAPSSPAEELLARLRALAAEQPDMTASELEAHQVGYMLRRRFPTLAAALHAARIRDWPRRDRRPIPSAQETLAAIAARRAAGQPITRAVVRRDDRALVRAAERHFGTWRRAVTAATRA
jgi:hypothetical protein